MKIGRCTLSAASVALVVFQLLLVSLIAAKYLYQRSRCPRVWTRAVAFDPDILMRGRYIGMRLTVDGCQSTLPSAKQATFPRDINGAITEGPYAIREGRQTQFRADLKAENNRLVAILIPDEDSGTAGQEVSAWSDAPCDAMYLEAPVDFYIAERALSPLPLKAGQQLWIEVTVPHKGPPRPIQLALKDGATWKPLAYQ